MTPLNTQLELLFGICIVDGKEKTTMYAAKSLILTECNYDQIKESLAQIFATDHIGQKMCSSTLCLLVAVLGIKSLQVMLNEGLTKILASNKSVDFSEPLGQLTSTVIFENTNRTICY